MAWLAGIVVLLLLVFSASFRKVAGIAVPAVALIVGIFILNQRQSEKEARERIPANELELTDMVLTTEYGSHKIVGRIRNRSPQYTLTAIGLTVTLEDCENDSPHRSCATIGEDKDHNYSVDIPPDQVRDFSGYIYPGDTKPKGKLVWHYSISYTEAK
jgi:hypothetical protein